MTEAQVVSVEIRGQRYPIRSTLDAQYVAGLASYVDEKMRAAAESTPSGDAIRLAVLAALNIADELFRCQEAQKARRRRWPSAPRPWSGSSTLRLPHRPNRGIPGLHAGRLSPLCFVVASLPLGTKILSETEFPALPVMVFGGSFGPTFNLRESQRCVVSMPRCEEA